jgi:hypothetical protein
MPRSVPLLSKRLSVGLITVAIGVTAGLLSFNRAAKPSPQAAPAAAEALPAVTSVPTKAGSLRSNSPFDFSLPSDLSDENLLTWARASITNSPPQLLDWAKSQTDDVLRERLLSILLRAWAEQHPREAIDWALAQDEPVRSSRIEAALLGVATNPTIALEIGRELLSRDSEHGNSYGAALVTALSAAGHFEAALQFSMENPAHAEADWFKTTFHRWAESDPKAAIKALDAIEDRSSRDAAFQAAITGWADCDYSALADYATSLPTGQNRAFALDTAMSQWCLQNPATLGEWLNNQPASPELDKAVATLITCTDTENRSPVVAMSWVDGIHDATLRSESLLYVMREWTAQDAAAAWKYFEEIPWLNDAQRAAVRKDIETLWTEPDPE